MRALLLAALLLAGCAQEPSAPSLTSVEPPVGTEWATCPPTASRALAVPFRAEETGDVGERAPGVHRLDARTFLWVWRGVEETLREDRVTRVNAVELARDTQGTVHVCTRVDVATPTSVDAEARTYGLGVRLSALDALPAGPAQVTVNWVAGCACSPLPRGNDTARFE